MGGWLSACRVPAPMGWACLVGRFRLSVSCFCVRACRLAFSLLFLSTAVSAGWFVLAAARLWVCFVSLLTCQPAGFQFLGELIFQLVMSLRGCLFSLFFCSAAFLSDLSCYCLFSVLARHCLLSGLFFTLLLSSGPACSACLLAVLFLQ